jgi:hypothetical protein
MTDQADDQPRPTTAPPDTRRRLACACGWSITYTASSPQSARAAREARSNHMRAMAECAWAARSTPPVPCARAEATAATPCADGHSYRRNAPPEPGDVCTVCRGAFWAPGLPHHMGLSPLVGAALALRGGQ